MDYNTLIANKTTAGSIKNWVNDDTIDPDTILVEAQAHIYGKLRVQEMLAVVGDSLGTTFTVAANAEYVAMPTGCLDTVNFRWLTPDLIQIEKLIVDQLDNRRLYNTDGSLVQDIPRWYAIVGGNFQFCVRNNVSRTAFIRYYKTPAALSSTNTTNFVTSTYPRLLRCFCMGIANEFKKDYDAATTWLGRGEEQLLEIAQTMDDLRLRGFKTYPEAG